MKKFIKWFLFGALVCGSLALAICYIVIPQETKSAADIVVEYMNTPLGIVGGTTITLGLVAGIIVKLVYDRYRDNINSDLEQAKSYVREQKQQAKDYYEYVVQYKAESIEMLESYSNRIDYITNQVVEICETSPNAKIKSIGEKIKNDSKELKQELQDNLTKLNNNFVEVVGRKEKVELLESKVNELTAQLERLVKEYGREETTNN